MWNFFKVSFRHFLSRKGDVKTVKLHLYHLSLYIWETLTFHSQLNQCTLHLNPRRVPVLSTTTFWSPLRLTALEASSSYERSLDATQRQDTLTDASEVGEWCSRCLQSSESTFFQGHHLKGHWTIRDSNQLYAAGLLSNSDAQSAGQEVTYCCYRRWSLGKSTTALYPSQFQDILYTGTYLARLPDQSQIYSFLLRIFLIHTKSQYIRVKVPRSFLQWKVRSCLGLIPLV
jgi:hypothetical protein